ncbi:MAG: CHAT domain-containing protein [Planctomycetaceae bacterium]|nr:CHAT domain-containing protein [Planctomycetaceae bacterium]
MRTVSFLIVMLMIVCHFLFASPVLAQPDFVPPSTPEELAKWRYLSNRYFSSQAFFDRGNYLDAMKQYSDELRKAVLAGRADWIDSICYHALEGECHYQMGNNEKALASFNLALHCYTKNFDWLRRLHFETTSGVQSRPKTPCPWGASRSSNVLAVIPDTVSIEYAPEPVRVPIPGSITYGPPVMMRQANPSEVASCLALALRRRAELLGPLGQHDRLNQQVLELLEQRPCIPRHWTNVWIDLFLGLALVTQGNDHDATPLLERSLALVDQADHPLTCIASLELGKIALRAEDYPTAYKYFYESGISAWHYGDAITVGESLQLLALAQKAMNPQKPSQIIPAALAWAETENMPGLQVLLNTLLAEDFIMMNNPTAAETHLRRAQAVAGGHDIQNGRLAGIWHYIKAATCYFVNNVAEGDGHLDRAMQEFRRTSTWIFQINRLEEFYGSGRITLQGPVTPRVAATLYEYLLREPTACDWLLRPAESLTVVGTPHSPTYERWFSLVMQQADHEKAFEIAELTRRHRFQSTLPLGSRVISLRFLLEAPEEMISREQILTRHRLFAEMPAFAELSNDVQTLGKEIGNFPLFPQEPEQIKKLKSLYRELDATTTKQEAMLRLIAMGRIESPNIFPPVKSFKAFRESLPEKTTVLMFFTDMGDYYGFLINDEQFDVWQIENTQTLKRDVSSYLTLLGQGTASGLLPPKDVSNGDWKTAGQLLFARLLGTSRDIDFSGLVVVPDGYLWYVPFETLYVELNGKKSPLIALAGRTIHYAPTAALALPFRESGSVGAGTVVLCGKLMRNDDAKVSRDAADRLSQSGLNVISITPSDVTLPPCLLVKFISQLVVFDDLPPPKNGLFDWAPFYGAKNLPGTRFDGWLALPWGGPRTVLLPGYHTAAEEAIKKGGDGAELFVPLVALQSCGTETVIISRWRPGGRSTFDLMTGFLTNASRFPAAEAWQRAVLQLVSGKLMPLEEPRLKGSVEEKSALDMKANHPFFWGAFLFCTRGERGAGEEQKQSDESKQDTPNQDESKQDESIPEDVT